MISFIALVMAIGIAFYGGRDSIDKPLPVIAGISSCIYTFGTFIGGIMKPGNSVTINDIIYGPIIFIIAFAVAYAIADYFRKVE